MYSDLPPALVWPDMPEARTDAMVHDPDNEVSKGYCPYYEEDLWVITDRNLYRKRCLNRHEEGDRTQNWCHRCMAGFIMLTPDDGKAYDHLGTHMDPHRL